ncbi:unnamed protein product [Durusdinium trenchii]|uniref:Uncharacterized protein n=2 Tax=Durusdinium trenchii TaxID=1381693 RepID=A0ABP0RF65_9DINO
MAESPDESASDYQSGSEDERLDFGQHPDPHAPSHWAYTEIFFQKTKKELAKTRHENHKLESHVKHLQEKIKTEKDKIKKTKIVEGILKNQGSPRVNDLKERLAASRSANAEAQLSAGEAWAAAENAKMQTTQLRKKYEDELQKVASAKEVDEEISQRLARRVEELQVLLRDLSDPFSCGCADARSAHPVEVSYVCRTQSIPECRSNCQAEEWHRA